MFDTNSELIVPNVERYIRAINNLLMAQSKLYKYKEYIETTEKFNAVKLDPNLLNTLNIKLLIFKYSATHQLNRYFILGEFSEGTKVIPDVATDLMKYSNRLDTSAILIFFYKFACMYFGNNQFKDAIFWLNKIINAKDVDLRNDIHCFARIMNLICHYELDNTDQVPYFIRSTYRFLIKKEDIHLFQQFTIRFIRNLPDISRNELVTAFKKLREELLPLMSNPYEKRAFIYFDMISWLESKIGGRTVQEIIKEKSEKRINAFV